jgi:hypothetical protein
MTNPTNVIGTTDTSYIGLKSYFERLILEQDRLRQTELAGLRTEITTRLDAADRAVVIQLDAKEKALMLKSAEVERRLEMLNGEAGRLAKVLAESVPREVWEQSQQGWNDWRTTVEQRLNLTSGRDRGIGLSWGTILGIGSIIGVLVLLFKTFVSK